MKKNNGFPAQDGGVGKRDRERHSGSGDPLEKALNAFREAWFSEKRPDPDAFCREHSALGPELKVMIEDFLFVVEGLPDPGPQGGGIAPDKVLGDFRIIREIGSGGMGTVYEAEQLSLKRRVALKVLPAHLSFSTEAVMKFRREAEAGGRQSHPGIVAIHAVGEHEGVHFIAQELVENGATLSDCLDGIRDEGKQPAGCFRETAKFAAEIADALEHAHQSGVIHRDIKPSNILLTKNGRPKVTDFGLAKIEDALALSRTGDFAGTPYYMSPEQAMSRRMGIDKRTDVYSMGVTLYEMLTLKRPFEGETSYEVLKKIMLLDPVDPHKANPRVPRDLGTICLKAMEKMPDRRYQSMSALAEDLRRFLSGDVILARPAGRGTRLWRRVKRNPVISAAVGVALLSLLTLVIVLPWVIIAVDSRAKKRIEEERNQAIAARLEAERQRGVAEEQTRVAEERLIEITRLSDMKRLSDLQAEADRLWPAYPDKVKDLKSWLSRAKKLLGRLDEHRRTLEAWRKQALPGPAGESIDGEEAAPLQAWKFDDVETQWRHDYLQDLVSRLERFSDPEDGLLKNVTGRLAFAMTIRQRSIDDHKEEWNRALASIADEGECPKYHGLKINPQIGLVPIGRNPDSGLFEFAHLQTGEAPALDEKGTPIPAEKMGLVFILIPAGEFEMGAVRPADEFSMGSPNVDPFAKPEEGPVHNVRLSPFFLSKYEMTQDQWLRFMGENPSEWTPGILFGNKRITPFDPVENVSWEQCHRVLERLGLRFPSESEWEYAARAGTSTVWWTGNDKKSLKGAANLLDLSCKKGTQNPKFRYEEWFEDGYVTHAPVGSLRPNPFGLHDVCGNVWEWCRDSGHPSYENAPADGSPWLDDSRKIRALRGGCWNRGIDECRSAHRAKATQIFHNDQIGLRPALSLGY